MWQAYVAEKRKKKGAGVSEYETVPVVSSSRSVMGEGLSIKRVPDCGVVNIYA